MKTCRKLQQFIEEIAKKYELDLDAMGTYLRLDVAGADHYLVIETLGACRISIARYLVSGQHQVADPEIVLYTAYHHEPTAPAHKTGEWVPIERLQRLGGWAIYADIDSQGTLLRTFDSQGQQDLAEYVETSLIKELITQTWLTQGCRSTTPKPYLTPEEQWLRGITFAYNDEPADSKSSLLMQKVALRLAQDHCADLSQSGIQLVLSLPHRPEQLTLMNLGDGRISVTRCVTDDDGQFVPDPNLIFRLTDTGSWQPEELLHSPQAWREYLAVVGKAAAYTSDNEISFVNFTEYWAQRLIDGGWVKHSRKLFEFSIETSEEHSPQEQIQLADHRIKVVIYTCIEFAGEDCTQLKLTPDGILAIEDKEGMRLSTMLPAWLEQAIRHAFQLQWQLARCLLNPGNDMRHTDDEVPF